MLLSNTIGRGLFFLDEGFVDVVDETDSAIDFAPSLGVYEKGIPHRVVVVLVFNPKGEVLVEKRSLGKEPYPGHFNSAVSGKVKLGESYVECARRKLSEEIGAGGLELEEVRKLRIKIGNAKVFLQLYRTVFSGKPRLNEKEAEELMWMPLASAKNLGGEGKKAAPVFLKCLEILGVEQGCVGSESKAVGEKKQC